jgi:oligoribonuclease
MWGIFLDLEATGLNVNRHRTLEIALQLVDLTTGQFGSQFSTSVCQPREVWDQASPTSLQVNGYTWERCCRGLSEAETAAQITRLLQLNAIDRTNSVFICQNPSFDRAFFSQLIDPDIQEQLRWPYHWLDLASMHWALSMHQTTTAPRLTLSKDQIAAAHGLPPEPKPHSAANGVAHLILCYQAVVGFSHPGNWNQ